MGDTSWTLWETFSPHEDSQAERQAAQGGSTVSDPGDFKDLTAHSPEEPGLTSELLLLWTRSWNRDLLRSLPAWTLLWIYNILWSYNDPIFITAEKRKKITRTFFFCLISKSQISSFWLKQTNIKLLIICKVIPLKVAVFLSMATWNYSYVFCFLWL